MHLGGEEEVVVMVVVLVLEADSDGQVYADSAIPTCGRLLD